MNYRLRKMAYGTIDGAQVGEATMARASAEKLFLSDGGALA